MEFNKPRVNERNIQNFQDFEECIYIMPKGINDTYNVMVLFEDGYAITVHGAPGEKKKTVIPWAKERIWQCAKERLNQKSSDEI